MQKTTFQNWVDNNYATQSELAKKANVTQSTISRDYNNPNGIKMLYKYCKKLGIKEVSASGIEYGFEVELINAKIK